jgi:DNA-directed RNA polymerase specialized sigma24 family protein
LDAKDLETKINTILNELPEKCKKVFCHAAGKPVKQGYFSWLSITVSTVEKHISKALKTLRSQI